LKKSLQKFYGRHHDLAEIHISNEHSERKIEENNEDEGEMETERDTTELEETLLDNDKQP
jgi:hypothetical protein